MAFLFLMKIKAILRSSEKQSLAVLDDSIAISDDNRWENKTYLQDIFKGIAAKRILNIEYKKADGTSSNRKLEPIGCYHQFNNWYLVAFCQWQSDYRTFKINRIAHLRVLEQHFDTKHINLQDYINQQNETWKAQQQFKEIEIAFHKSLIKYAESRKYYFGFVKQIEEKEVVRIKFLNSSLELIARWLLQFGDQATVIAPNELKDRLKTLARELYAHYH